MVDEIKLNFLLCYYPSIKAQARKAKEWPLQFHFTHPEADLGDPDAECIVEISEEEMATAEKAWEYYLGE